MSEPANDTSPIPCVPIARGVRYQVVGNDTVFFLQSTHGDELALRIPSAGLHGLRAMVHDAINDAEQAAQPPAMIAFKYPQSFSVGHSDQVRNHVALCFDQGAPGAVTFMLADETATNLIRQIAADMGGRKRKTDLRNGIAVPAGPKLILPER
jgi:hypothetical protein